LSPVEIEPTSGEHDGTHDDSAQPIESPPPPDRGLFPMTAESYIFLVDDLAREAHARRLGLAKITSNASSHTALHEPAHAKRARTRTTRRERRALQRTRLEGVTLTSPIGTARGDQSSAVNQLRTAIASRSGDLASRPLHERLGLTKDEAARLIAMAGCRMSNYGSVIASSPEACRVEAERRGRRRVSSTTWLPPNPTAN
jgi:hypothetical protein